MAPIEKVPVLKIDSVYAVSQNQIKVSIEIVNTYPDTIEYSTISKKPPLKFLVLDNKGISLYSDSTKEGPKNRTTRNVTYKMAGGEEANHAITLKLSKDMKDGSGAKAKWSIIATLPIVKYVNGSYKVTLLKSNNFEFEVEHRDDPKAIEK